MNFIKLLMLLTILFLVGCKDHLRLPSVYISVLSNPSGAKVFLSINSDVEGVKSSKRELLGRTPYRRALLLDINGLTNSNYHKIYLILEIVKGGYYKKVETIDFKQSLAIRKLKLKYNLVKKDALEEEIITTSLIPKNVTASQGDYKEYVKVVWDKVLTAKKYHIYRDIKKEGRFKERIALIKGLFYLDISAKKKKVYYYRVKAYDKNGNSGLSLVVKGFRKLGKENKKEKKNKKDKGNKKGKEGAITPKVSGGVSSLGGASFGIVPIVIPSAGGTKTKPVRGTKNKQKLAKKKKKKKVFKNISG